MTSSLRSISGLKTIGGMSTNGIIRWSNHGHQFIGPPFFCWVTLASTIYHSKNILIIWRDWQTIRIRIPGDWKRWSGSWKSVFHPCFETENAIFRISPGVSLRCNMGKHIPIKQHNKPSQYRRTSSGATQQWCLLSSSSGTRLLTVSNLEMIHWFIPASRSLLVGTSTFFSLDSSGSSGFED